MAEETAHAYHLGIHAAKLIRAHFAEFYETHVAAKIIEPGLLLGCAVAFWQLVEDAGVALRWPGDTYGELDREATPELSLVCYSDVSSEFMSELGYSLSIPRPVYYGLGVQSVLEEWASLPDALAIALWHLFSKTRLSLGISLEPHLIAEAIGEAVHERIMRLKPLPADTPLETLALHLELPEASEAVSVRDLLNYAFGKTENDLANYSDYEVEAIYMGEVDEEWDWTQIAELARLSAEAKAIDQAYARWNRRVNADPEREIIKLAAALNKARRAALQEMDAMAKPLIELLGNTPDDARHFVEMVNSL